LSGTLQPGYTNLSQQRFDTDRFINFSGSVWRLKVGVSYQF